MMNIYTLRNCIRDVLSRHNEAHVTSRVVREALDGFHVASAEGVRPMLPAELGNEQEGFYLAREVGDVAVFRRLPDQAKRPEQ